MSRNFFLSIVMLLAITVFSCSKKTDKQPTKGDLSDTPIAKLQFDNSNYGIYKGVFVGSSGVILININNDNTISVMLKIDNTPYNFTTTQTIQQNQATTLNFVNGSNSFTFTVDANGANPTITNLVMNGHPNAAILVLKETSKAIVKCYEGTYTGGDMGTFNTVTYNTVIKGLVKSNSDQTDVVNGKISGNTINAGTVTTGATFSGTISGNNVSGAWNNSQAGLSGSWSGVRTY